MLEYRNEFKKFEDMKFVHNTYEFKLSLEARIKLDTLIQIYEHYPNNKPVYFSMEPQEFCIADELIQAKYIKFIKSEYRLDYFNIKQEYRVYELIF